MNNTIIARAAGSHRRKLLTTVSAFALLGLVYDGGRAAAADADRPLIWIELGGQLDRVSGKDDPFVPPFAALGAQNGLVSLSTLETLPRYSLGEDGRISFQPENSDWIFSASIRYGRSGAARHKHEEINAPYFRSPNGHHFHIGSRVALYIAHTADYTVAPSEKHAIMDFQAGKDVGLGIFGSQSTSQIGLGVRFAQFSSKTRMKLLGDPDPHFGSYKYISSIVPSAQGLIPLAQYFQLDKAKPSVSRSFFGIGPSFTWSNSAEVAGGKSRDAEITFDWGVNAAVLFGKQRVHIQHQTTGDTYFHRQLRKYYHNHYVNSALTDRSHTVMVPDIGGFAGLSFRYADAKVSLGYRADFFFNAIDGGIDTRKSENRGFFGPFASVSVGLGD